MATNRKSYSLDGAIIGEQADFDTEAVSYDVTEFGWINRIDFTVDRNVNQFKGVKGGTGGHKFQKNIQLLTRVTGTISFSPTDFKFHKYGLGNYSEGGGDYIIVSQGTMPAFLSLKGNYDGTKAAKLIGIALGNMTFKVSNGSIVEISAPFTAKSIDIITESIEYTNPTINPLTFIDGSMVYNSNDLLINDITINTDLKASPRRNFEAVNANSKYYISDIIRTGFVPSFSGNADIEDASSEIEDFLGGSNGNIAKSDFNIVLNFIDANANAHSMTISGCLDNSFTKGLTGDVDNVKNYDFGGVALDVSVTGVL